MRVIKIIIVGLVVGLAGCASGVKYQNMVSSIPPIQQDQGRIFFYRSANIIGAALQPSIVLDGVKVGTSKTAGFFYVDRTAGMHEVVITTEVEKKLSFNLAQQETKYIKTTRQLGFLLGRIVPEEADPVAAKTDLLDLSYTGDKSDVHGGATVQTVSSRISGGGETSASQFVAADSAPQWTGLMSCGARMDDKTRVAYQAKFVMEIRDNLVTVHRLTPKVAETLTGQITNNLLELHGEGYKLETPDRRWQFKIAGSIQPGAPIYAGAGNMLTKGKPIRACELTMTRL